MKLLLDTHILLWVSGRPERLSTATLSELSNPLNELFFSAASIWEITIKSSLGRQDFVVDPRTLRDRLLAEGYVELRVTSEHAIGVALLPHLHGDPFDRILLAQAVAEGMTLVTADERVADYPAPVQKV